MRIHVENGELSLLEARFVEGPLAEPPELHPGLVYEVTLASRRIAAGSIADAGVWRSFPDPFGTPGLDGHHMTELPSYEFVARVPVQDLTISSLARMAVTLYRWQGTGPSAPAADRQLKTQLKGRVRPVATLKGIRASRLPKRSQMELRKAFR